MLYYCNYFDCIFKWKVNYFNNLNFIGLNYYEFEETKSISNINESTSFRAILANINEQNLKSYEEALNEFMKSISDWAIRDSESTEVSSVVSSLKFTETSSIKDTKDIKSDYKNSHELFNDLISNRGHIEEILRKWVVYFKGKEKQEISSFVKMLQKLVFQHVGKHLKTKPIYLFSDAITSTVMLLLIYYGVLEWDFIRTLSESQIWTLNNLDNSTSININLENLNECLIKNNLQKLITKPGLKNSFDLNGDIEDYTHIWFYMIETSIKWNFFRDKNELTSIGKLKNLMGNILDSYRKSNDCTANIKEFITKEKDLKYLTVNVFKKLGLIEEGTEKLTFNDHEIDNIVIDYKRRPEKLEEQLKQKIKEIIEENKSPT